jgi:twinkle protein
MTAVDWLKTRGISKETAELAGVRSADPFFPQLGRTGPAVAFPTFKDGQIVNIKYRSLEKKLFTQMKGGSQVFYNRPALIGAEILTITEGEMDALALIETGYSNVVSCPNGAPAVGTKNLDQKLFFIEEAAELLEGIEEIVLCLDKDAPGLEWEKTLSDKLGAWRCSTVDYPGDCKDANDVLLKHGRETLVKALDNAKPVPVRGVATFDDFRGEILEYYQNPSKHSGLSTGWNRLDDHFRLMPGSLNIVTGIPSSGKSEWLDQLMLQATALHRWKWAVFSPENYPPAFHFQKLAEKLNRKPMFKQWSIPPMTGEDVSRSINALSMLFKILTIDEGALDVDGILDRFKLCVRRDGIKGCVVDPYNEIEHSRPAAMTETEYISSFLTKCRNFARINDVAVFIVAHPTKLHKERGVYPCPTAYDISGSANWRNKADNCLAVWRSNKPGDTEVQVHIQKVRNKNCGKTGFVKFDWTPATGLYREKQY